MGRLAPPTAITSAVPCYSQHYGHLERGRKGQPWALGSTLSDPPGELGHCPWWLGEPGGRQFGAKQRKHVSLGTWLQRVTKAHKATQGHTGHMWELWVQRGVGLWKCQPCHLVPPARSPGDTPGLAPAAIQAPHWSKHCRVRAPHPRGRQESGAQRPGLESHREWVRRVRPTAASPALGSGPGVWVSQGAKPSLSTSWLHAFEQALCLLSLCLPERDEWFPLQVTVRIHEATVSAPVPVGVGARSGHRAGINARWLGLSLAFL